VRAAYAPERRCRVPVITGALESPGAPPGEEWQGKVLAGILAVAVSNVRGFSLKLGLEPLPLAASGVPAPVAGPPAVQGVAQTAACCCSAPTSRWAAPSTWRRGWSARATGVVLQAMQESCPPDQLSGCVAQLGDRLAGSVRLDQLLGAGTCCPGSPSALLGGSGMTPAGEWVGTEADSGQSRWRS